jgi:hypothetical protein
MEFFVPSLTIILVSVLIFFFIFPHLSPYLLGGLAIVMFFLGAWHHYNSFPYEYKVSMATEVLKDYAGFIMLLIVIIAGVSGIIIVHGDAPPSIANIIPEMPNISNMPAMAMPAMPNMANMANMPNLNPFNLNAPSNNGNKPSNANKPPNTNNVNRNKPTNNVASNSFKTV